MGLACLPVYGAEGEEPRARAERLGVALQLINILRDVEEDTKLGRVYLPQDELAAFGVSEADLAAGRVTDGWRRLAAFQAERARGWLSDGLGLLAFLDRRSALCVRTFAGIYGATLDEIEARGYDVFDGEVRALHAREARDRRAGAARVMVAVVGGGLAGLAAALDLVDGGADVTLYEARPTLGGAVQTLPRREGDPEPPPDNGQHIALGCFTEYLALPGADRLRRRRAPRAARPAGDRRGRLGRARARGRALAPALPAPAAPGPDRGRGLGERLRLEPQSRTTARPSASSCAGSAPRSSRSTASGTSSSGRR